MTQSLFPDLATRAERRITQRHPQPTLDALSMGAGVQGVTIALLIAHGLLPKPQYAIFADTGWEPAAVYRQLQRVQTELFEPHGIKLLIVSKGNIRDEIHDKHAFTRIPAYTRKPDGAPGGLLKRTCTPHFKLAAIFRAHRQLLGAPSKEIQCAKCEGTGYRIAPWLTKYGNEDIGPCSICGATGTVLRVGKPPTGHWIRSWIGFSVDEIDRCAPSPVPYSEVWHPLLEPGIRFTRDDCKTYLADHGWSDVVKSACIGCPYRTNHEWQQIKNNPDEWAQAIAADEAIRHQPGLDGTAYLHKDRIPLAIADISATGRDGPTEHQGCSPYGCRSGDPLDMPALWDDLDEVL